MAMEQIRPVMLLMRDFPMSKFAQLDAVIMFRWACLNRDPRRFGFLLDFFLPSSGEYLHSWSLVLVFW